MIISFAIILISIYLPWNSERSDDEVVQVPYKDKLIHGYLLWIGFIPFDEHGHDDEIGPQNESIFLLWTYCMTANE